MFACRIRGGGGPQSLVARSSTFLPRPRQESLDLDLSGVLGFGSGATHWSLTLDYLDVFQMQPTTQVSQI